MPALRNYSCVGFVKLNFIHEYAAVMPTFHAKNRQTAKHLPQLKFGCTVNGMAVAFAVEETP
jgi:hypothetical protein